MNEIPRSFIDGRCFLTGSPFRSAWFWVITALGIGALVTDVVLLIQYHHLLDSNASVALGALVGIQLLYQLWRTLRYYARIRTLYSMKSADEAKEGSPLDLAIRIATGGLTDLLFYCFGITLVMLVVAGVLLMHLNHVAR